MEAVRQIFNPTPKNMIQMLDLHYPIYRKTAVYGHFGRELPEFTWEMTDQVDKLTDYFGIRRKATGKDKSRLPVETSAERYRRISAGITINYDELRQFHTIFAEERLREITRESDIKFDTDFKKFMESKYVQNRVIIEDHWTQHYLFIKYSMIPQITEKMKGKEHTFKGEYAFMNDSPSTDVCLQLLRKDSDKYILITKTPNLTDPKVFQDKIGNIYPGCKTQGNPFHNGSTNSGQMYIAVIHFVRKYFAPSQKCPYSHITVHRMDTGMETSRIVARFEDGEELTISDNS